MKECQGTISAIMHQNPNEDMALEYRDIMIKEPRSVDKGISDVQGNVLWERLKIPTVPIVGNMGMGTDGLEKMRETIDAENEGVTIPAKVRWLTNPRTIQEGGPRGEIKVSSVVFVVKRTMAAQRLVRKGVPAVGVWFKVKLSTNAGPDSLCDLCCESGHIVCRSNLQPKCGISPKPQRFE